MKIGKLDLPEVELELYNFHTEYGSRLYLQYREIIETTEIGRTTIKNLSADSRIQDLLGREISFGNTSKQFEIELLAMWFLWFANKVGLSKAKEALDDFLNSQKIQILKCLWLSGIIVEQEIELCDGMKLIPIGRMTDTSDKERLLRNRLSLGYYGPSPGAALVCSCYLNKVQAGDVTDFYIREEDFIRTDRKLRDSAQLFNLLPDVSCFSYYSTSYAPDSVPFGPFNGSGGGLGTDDVLGQKEIYFLSEYVANFEKIYYAYSNLPDGAKERWIRILSRLGQSKRKMQIEDKVLDLGIFLEMLLLEDNKNSDQLSLAFRLRGSWLVSSNEDERIENYKTLKDIYESRCQVAHTGILGEKKLKSMNFDKYQEIAEKIGTYLLINGKPDWNKLVLGIVK